MELKRKHKVLIAISAAVTVLAAVWLFCLPRDLFKGTSYSTVVYDRSGELLGARISDDGQWRFPPCEKAPERFATAIVAYEDRHFYSHPGIDPLAVARAVRQNAKAGRVVSGASTLTMQVIRLSRGRERTISQKMIEAFLATRLEARYSKDEILALYASHAPFGGNVVGIEAASWRYFGRGPEDLSWGEAATLAVLPNAPALIHPGRNRELLLEKRNSLLKRLYDSGTLDAGEYDLAVSESLPDSPVDLPSYAFHLVDDYAVTRRGERMVTDIDISLQTRVEDLAARWNSEFSTTGVADLSIIVMDVESGATVAYVGNAAPNRDRPGAKVDIARSPRSSGSILKPFLYEACLNDGEILPGSLLPDIPTNINGFAPQNFNLRFSGAVPASEALARSLNIPFVNLLRRFGVSRFKDRLESLGMTTLTRDASDYGLSLILGGGEVRLDEIVRMYRDLALRASDISAHHTLEALSEVNRPDEMDWRMVPSLRRISWKTGTSYGFRDAWAVGVTPKWCVGVWAGNALGQGSFGLVGARTAGPVLFDVFNMLPRDREWFPEPSPSGYVRVEVCPESGYLAGPDCERRDTVEVAPRGAESRVCPYHRTIGGEPRFLLPPAMENFYRHDHPEYRPLTRNDRGKSALDYSPIEFIYPEPNCLIALPRQLDGSIKGVTFSIAHADSDATVYWHLDSSYIAVTNVIHELTMGPDDGLTEGRHHLTCVDSDGNSVSVGFSVSIL